MSTKVTITLPDRLIEHAQQFGKNTNRDVETVLADALELMWPTLDEPSSVQTDFSISQLSDREILALAALKMNREQSERLGDLQTKGKTEGLTSDERYELLALMQIYQRGHLRKSEAMAEAARRGLRSTDL
jgi:hypothetical protein